MMQQTKRSIQWIIENKTFFLPKKKKYAGIHVIAEFWNGKAIESEKELELLLADAVKAAEVTPLKSIIYKFEPQGITGVVLLAESHISIHTWPELNYTAIDLFTCGDKSRPEKALESLRQALKPERVEIKKIKRGGLSF
jgi:S-adenosylmethionine decarboxylase